MNIDDIRISKKTKKTKYTVYGYPFLAKLVIFLFWKSNFFNSPRTTKHTNRLKTLTKKCVYEKLTTKWKLSPADQNGYAGQNGPTSGGLILFTTAVINILSWILGQLYMFFLVRKNVSRNFKYMLYFDWLSAQNNEFCLYYGFFGIQTYGFLLWSYSKINVNLWKIDFFEKSVFFVLLRW